MDTETISAIVLVLVVYASLTGAALQWARQRAPRPADSAGAFRLLETALKRSFPDMPQGFTIREGLVRARGAGLALRWEAIDQTLAEYEAYRYGGAPIPGRPPPELVRLVKVLWRRRR